MDANVISLLCSNSSCMCTHCWQSCSASGVRLLAASGSRNMVCWMQEYMGHLQCECRVMFTFIIHRHCAMGYQGHLQTLASRASWAARGCCASFCRKASKWWTHRVNVELFNSRIQFWALPACDHRCLHSCCRSRYSHSAMMEGQRLLGYPNCF